MTEQGTSGNAVADVDIVIEWLGGNCPVQAEGTINGKRFYFRARYDSWSLEISPDATEGQTYTEWPDNPDTWYYDEEWGDGPYAAGWMPEETAREMIAKGAALYAASLPAQEPTHD